MKAKIGIHQFFVGDILQKGNFVGIVSKKRLTSLHKHPFIVVKGFKMEINSNFGNDRVPYRIKKRFYIPDGLIKLGELR